MGIKNYKRKALGYLAISIAILLCIVIANFSSVDIYDVASDLALTPTANAPLNTTYSAFYNNSTYRYTDTAKVESMHSGAISDDTTIQTVDSTKDHGSKENPFVIDSVTKWNAFASDMNTTSSGITDYGKGKYFALATDLNFSGVAFTYVKRFDGNFYGLGHTLSDVTCSFGNTGLNGAFGSAYSGAIIADLNLSNATMTDVYVHAALLCGYSEGASILNCHATGNIIRNTRTSVQINAGGILGSAYGTTPTLVYRCSAEYTGSVLAETKNGALLGSVVGGTGGTASFTILDCYGRCTFDYSSVGADAYVGGMLGAVADKQGAIRIENGASYIFQKNLQNVTAAHVASLLGYWAGTYAPSSITIKNTYTSGKGSRNGTEFDVYPTAYITAQASVVNKSAFTLQNVNWYASSNIKFDNSGYSNVLAGKSGVTQISSSESALWSAAQSSSALPSAIWVKKSAIGGTYSLDNSPVRNIFDDEYTVKFYDFSATNGDESMGIDDIDYKYGSAVTLPTKPTRSANQVFVGWTMDKTGEGEIFDGASLPSNLNGDITLYAVWDNPNVTASISVTNTDATATPTTTLEYGKGVITLKAVVTTPGMTSTNNTFKWYKDSDTTALKTAETYEIKNVNQTGIYKLEYEVKDATYPLWSHSVKLSATTVQESVTVTQGQIHLDSFKLDSAPYYGMDLQGVNFTAEVKDGGANVVSGTFRWEYPNQQVADGDNTLKILFTPDDSDNYGGRQALDVPTFKSQYVTLTFDMDEDTGHTMTVNLQYNKTYKDYEIKQLFLQEFYKIIDDPTSPEYVGFNSVANRTPKFGESGIDFNSYNGQITNVTKPETIKVTFDNSKSYTVTYDDDNGNTSTETRKFNEKLQSAPTPTKSGEIFIGWYFDDIDSNGSPLNRQWIVSTDRVTNNVTLTAKWITANLTLTGITVTQVNSDGVNALTEIDGSQIKVVAHFDTDSAIQPTMDLIIDMGGNDGYSVEYDSSDNKLHVDDTGISVTYAYDSVTFTEQFSMKVNPIKVDMSKVAFNDKTVVYDGTVKSIDSINLADLPLIVDETSIVYEYAIGTTKVEPTSVINPGEYNVTARMSTKDVDYIVEPLTAVLTIARPATLVTVEWDSATLSYNAKPQHPTPTIKDSSGNILNIDYHFEGDENATAIGSTYSITLVLDNKSYAITDGSDKISFSIAKALLAKPTVKVDASIVYDGTQKNLEEYLDGFDKDLMEIMLNASGIDAKKYTATISLKDTVNCSWASGNMTENVEWTIEKAHLTADWNNNDEHIYDGAVFQPTITKLIGIASVDESAVNLESDIIYNEDGINKSQVGAYTIVARLNDEALWTKNYVLDSNAQWDYVILPKSGMQVVTIEWGETTLVFNGKVQMPTYVVYDKDGNDVTEQVKSKLTFSGDWDKSKWADDYTLTVNQPSDTYFIKSGLTCNYSISLDENGNGYNPNPDGENESGGLGDIGQILKDYWQAIVSGVCLILTIAFLAKTASYESRRKKANKTADERYKTYYAGAVGLFGLASTSWTIIACVFIGVTLFSLVIMLIAKSRCGKAEDGLAYAREDFERNKAEADARQRDENMRMMLMGMFGGNNGGGMSQGGYVVQQGIGAEEMRGLIAETVTALLPGVQQALPQQASTNDEVIKKLVENQELLMKKMAEQPERVVEKQVVATTSVNDETIKKMMENQEKLMEKILELSANKEPQVIEKEVIKEVPVEVEKIVEKEVKVEVPVEKVVEKEVIKEVPVEKIVEVPVEKVVEKEVVKEVKVPVAAPIPTKPKKETAPRLTLDEAYALLSKQQQKYFDGLREYALTKDKCKEKKSTYFVVFGQSTVNPLMKLTIKKGKTVALFKMEDEYLKDIKRDATSDGTKVKVKETEVTISDAQSCKVAKNMIDLREDQIERYQELLKEQRALNKKK